MKEKHVLKELARFNDFVVLSYYGYPVRPQEVKVVCTNLEVQPLFMHHVACRKDLQGALVTLVTIVTLVNH